MLNLKESSLDWAIKSIDKGGDSYVFPYAFEFEAIKEYWQEVKQYLLRLDISKNGLRDYRTAITPKSRLGFRVSTQLDPLDSIIFNAIIYEISEDIEKSRISLSEKKVFSHRLQPKDDGTLYDENYKWATFNNEAKKILDSPLYNTVVVTDISDFYPSIYLHDIEKYLRECVKSSGHSAHVEVLLQAIKAMHINQTHKGLPIGPQFSRPIAELILNEIDKIMLERNIPFIRYVDDYRIFCNSETEGYKHLAFLAQKLYDMLNLKLNEQKTRIIEKNLFLENHLRIFDKSRIFEEEFAEEFYALCEELGISLNDYDELDLDSIGIEDIEKIESFNFLDILKEELKKENPDCSFAKFIIGNLARFDNTFLADIILHEDNIGKLSPILRTVINYLHRVKSFNIEQKHEIGGIIINLLNTSFISELEFNRSWLLSLFTKDNEWNNQQFFNQQYIKYNDSFTKRELMLALGRAQKIDFFRENKFQQHMDPWVMRAFLASISCLPEDERNAYYRSRSFKNRDFLDIIIEKWAKKNHF